ncbi:unnamed protein product, partial [Urochloa humidicola]
ISHPSSKKKLHLTSPHEQHAHPRPLIALPKTRPPDCRCSTWSSRGRRRSTRYCSTWRSRGRRSSLLLNLELGRRSSSRGRSWLGRRRSSRGMARPPEDFAQRGGPATRRARAGSCSNPVHNLPQIHLLCSRPGTKVILAGAMDSFARGGSSRAVSSRRRGRTTRPRSSAPPRGTGRQRRLTRRRRGRL